ncbi:MAG: undecaprenyl/decaprenyl-phosphate alpha-N-acetylglucosaminyl 1-phosphate transferase [Bacteroidaceae bacterium]|nr:undecaprenyl/decaprenyl-phosphate alpha-N-acetylglucosaminyl 1-phosphate transferase [Bacteroidaceae bacterium]
MTLHELLRIVQTVVPALVSLVAVRWVFFKVLRIANEKEIVDNPEARKLQKEPVPVLGGIAVLFGVLCGLLTGCALIGTDGTTVFLKHQDVWQIMGNLLPVVLGMGVMVYVGVMDDIIGVKPSHRILVEVLTILGLIYGSGACVNDLHGVWDIHHFNWSIAVPLTVFAGVAIINAINMVDGVNGLSSGLCMVYCAVFGVAFARSSDWVNAVLAFSMVGSLFPFFVHNVFGKTSRMFIGDAGAMVMGILLTWFTISILRSDTFIGWMNYKLDICLVALCLAIMSVPLADLARVTVMRAVRGKNPFAADKTHLHHALIAAGMSHLITTLVEILLDLMVVGIFVVGYKMKLSITNQLYLVCVSGAVLVWGTYAFLNYHATHKTRTYEKLKNLSRHSQWEQKKWWLRFQTWLDEPNW